MAKKRTEELASSLSDLFAKTAAAAPSEEKGIAGPIGIQSPILGIDLQAGKVQPTGLGLRGGTLDALRKLGEVIGNKLGTQPVPVNSVGVSILEHYLEQLQAGKIPFEELLDMFQPEELPKAKRRR